MGGAPKKSVILLSGGLDSAANLAFCRERDEPVLAITVDYGQRAFPAERLAASRLCEYYGVGEHAVLDLRWLGRMGGSALTDTAMAMPHPGSGELDDATVTRASASQVWVPNRNGVLINVAAAYAERAGATQVVVGFNAEEAATFPDNSAGFLDAATRALAYSTRAGMVAVRCYTTAWDKLTIVRELKRLSRPFPVELVWSCYEAGPVACGQCESCRRLARALGGPEAGVSSRRSEQ